MAFTRNLSVILPLGIIAFCLFLYGLSDGPIIQPKLKEQSRYLADIFVPLGKKYNQKDNIIYHCLSTNIFKHTDIQGETREFVIGSNNHKSEGAESRSKAFQDYFDNQKWIPKKTPGTDKMSENYHSSGIGSTLEAGQPPLALLNSLIERLKTYLHKSHITIIDIPCGDFYWIKQLVGLRSDVQYTGIDIVPTLIDRHRKNYQSWKNANFQNFDIVSSGLNQSYDIIFCRDMLQHLNFADALKVLEHFSSSGSKLLVTTQMTNPINNELPRRYRPLNLMIYPFNLVPPVCSMYDSFGNRIKEISVWTLPLRQSV